MNLLQDLGGRWRRDIVLRLWIGLLLALLVSTSLYSAYAIVVLQREASSLAQDRASRMADVLSQALQRPLFDINQMAVQSVVDAIGGFADVESLQVQSPDGAVLAHASAKPASGDAAVVTVRRSIDYAAGSRVYPVGVLVLSVASGTAETALRWRIAQTLGVNFLLALGMALAVYAVARAVGRPFADVQKALEQLAQGDTGIHLSGLHRQDQIGRLSRAVERFRDVLTQLRQAEHALVELNTGLERRIAERTHELSETVHMLLSSQQKLQAIVDTALDAVVRADLQGVVVGWNRQAQTLFGWTAGQALGCSLHELIAPHDLWDMHRQRLQALVATPGVAPGTARIETRALNRAGQEFLVAWDTTPVVFDDGGAIELCSFISDITLRKRAEEQTRAALQHQSELADLRSRFVSMTSHEFRTPLTSILSSVELLQHYAARMQPSEQAALFQSIESNVHRMTHMLERVLLIGQADANRLDYSPGPMDLAAFCRQLVQEVAAQYPSSSCQLSTEFPAAPEPVQFDAHLLRHVLINLLSNAFKYSPQGGQIGFAYGHEGAVTTFCVSDQGIGIPPDEMPHLFDTFHRASNVGEVAGTGLGLSIVKRSAELHRGSVGVTSALGVGTVFTVRLDHTGVAG